MSGGSRERAGRKPINIDPVVLENMCALHCTEEEMAPCLGVSVRTLQSRFKQRQFAEARERGRAKGKISLRRAQMKLVEQGNAAMAIWLGKQLLGQRDVTPVELTGTAGQPLRISLEAIDAILAHSKESKRRRSSNNP